MEFAVDDAPPLSPSPPSPITERNEAYTIVTLEQNSTPVYELLNNGLTKSIYKIANNNLCVISISKS